MVFRGFQGVSNDFEIVSRGVNELQGLRNVSGTFLGHFRES